MNFKYKRSVLSRPLIFQEGGSNIFLGNAEPYSVAIPLAGPSANPAVSNKAIEINTTGISDQINKQKDLAYKWAELQFKYKDLEYKEGRDYLEATRDVYKSLGTTKEMIDAIGGVGSLGQYKDESASYMSGLSTLHSEAAQSLGRRDLTGFSNAVAKMGQLATGNADLRFKTTALTKMLDAAAKGEMGYNTKGFMDVFFNHINNGTKPDGTPYTFDEVLNTGIGAIGLKLDSKSVFQMNDNFFKKYAEKPIKTDTGIEILPNGIKKIESGYLLPTKEQMMAEYKRMLLQDERGKSYLHNNNINPDNPNSQELNKFVEDAVNPIYDTMMSLYGPTVTYEGSPMKDVEVKGFGEKATITSIPEEDTEEGGGGTGGRGRGGKLTQAEKLEKARKDAIKASYGEEAVNDPDIESIVLGIDKHEDYLAALEKKLKEKGYSKILLPGQVAEKGEDGLVPGTLDLPNTLEGIISKFNLTDIDQARTKVVDKDGTRYLVTNDDKVISPLKQYSKALKMDTGLLGQGNWDETVWDKTGLTEREWDFKKVIDPNATIFNLGPSPKGTETASVSAPIEGLLVSTEKLEGDSEFSTLNKEGTNPDFPRQQDFKNPVSARLVRLSEPVLRYYEMEVTDTSDSKIHRSKAQTTYKTSFDVQFANEKGRGIDVLPFDETITKIPEVMESFGRNNLRAVYELGSKQKVDQFFDKYKELTGEDFPYKKYVISVPYATGNHFSIFCYDCTPWGAKGEKIGGIAEAAPPPNAEDLRKTLLTSSSISSRVKDGRLKEEDMNYLVTFLGNPDIQEGYLRDVRIPSYNKKARELKKNFPTMTSKFTDNEIMYIIHHEGPNGATYFFQNNKDRLPKNSTEMYNIHPENSKATSNSVIKNKLPLVATGSAAEKFGEVESSNSYTSVNKKSSAIGKYQIMVTWNLDSMKDYMDQYYEENPDAFSGEGRGEEEEEGTTQAPAGSFFDNFKKKNPEFGGQ